MSGEDACVWLGEKEYQDSVSASDSLRTSPHYLTRHMIAKILVVIRQSLNIQIHLSLALSV